MGKTKFCRICRTEENLKYTTKELKQLNKKHLLAQVTKQGQANDRASKKLLLTTPTLGNICQICDERIQIFHRLDGGHDSSSDVEIDVVNNINKPLHMRFVDTLSNGDVQMTQRPETPVIVDDDDMLFNIFMQKFDQKVQMPQQISSSYPQQQLDNKQFQSQFHSTFTPPQSTGGSSEGDESKVVEVLTSRESTPAPTQSLTAATSSNMVDPQGHRIVAIIELDDDENENEQKNYAKTQRGICAPGTTVLLDSCQNIEFRSDVSTIIKDSNKEILSKHLTCKGAELDDDDEEIVFCKVNEEKSPVLKRRKRKSYDEKQLRLVATLNLVSSDSESEDSTLKVQEKKNPNAAAAEHPVIAKKKSFVCKVCDQKFPDLESLSVHERIHQGVKCILCQICFQQVKRLIHHMRRKHRQYNGDTLSEKPRSGQDSCMTIRLRYMQHTTFYECQLCGRIDDVFKEHKEHIIEKHPNESKSLKDPIMKQLKCPICKAKCGAQYLSLSRHLISSHEYQEYKSHLRELVHVSAFGWNACRQQEVAKTAKIFQFVKRKTFFFQCKICCKVVAGYLHHLRHVNEHQNAIKNNTKVKLTAMQENFPLKASTNITSSDSSNLKKLYKSLKKDGACISKTLRNKDISTKKLASSTNLRSKTKHFEKGVKISNKLQKPKLKENDVKRHIFNSHQTEKMKKPIKTAQSKKSKVEEKIQSRKTINLKTKCKPKDEELENVPNRVKLTKGKLKNDTIKKDKKKFKDKSSKIIEQKFQMKKVKIKTLIRQIDLQKYKCKYCFKNFKGFRLYNLHLLRQHKENEYTKCNKCNKLFAYQFHFEEHINQCSQSQVLTISKQKRKFYEKSVLPENSTVSIQPHVKKVPNQNNSACLEDNYIWLKDLLKLKKPLEVRVSSLTCNESQKNASFYFQCCYCLHLFANENKLKEHKEHFHSENRDILLKYKPFKRSYLK